MAESAKEDAIRAAIVAALPAEIAPVMLRLAFHDAGTYDAVSHTGGANGAIHLADELARQENSTLGPAVAILGGVKEAFAGVSWADMIAVGGAAAVERCGGPTIRVGLGRIDATEAAPKNRLPRVDEDDISLKDRFAAMGLTLREVAILGGAHTLGKTGGKGFTHDPYSFDTSFYRELLRDPADATLGRLPTDTMLVDHAETRPFVERYAADQAAFFADFAETYKKVTWLGQIAAG